MLCLTFQPTFCAPLRVMHTLFNFSIVYTISWTQSKRSWTPTTFRPVGRDRTGTKCGLVSYLISGEKAHSGSKWTVRSRPEWFSDEKYFPLFTRYCIPHATLMSTTCHIRKHQVLEEEF
ncbi:hypothetical protein DVH24_021191 [Malus domestica]|uniref:Uncharacterized protein n=1 Tax=Malus domestica TaxID=3750 RepID=A0A498KTR6_MALDO|nr:hypothetical protein DVH24_021191 [Malus domestica]